MAMTDEQRKARLHHHMYETCEGIAEHAERIVRLEEVIAEMYPFVGDTCPEGCRWREECNSDSNKRSDGAFLMCLAYNRYYEILEDLGIEVGK